MNGYTDETLWFPMVTRFGTMKLQMERGTSRRGYTDGTLCFPKDTRFRSVDSLVISDGGMDEVLGLPMVTRNQRSRSLKITRGYTDGALCFPMVARRRSFKMVRGYTDEAVVFPIVTQRRQKKCRGVTQTRSFVFR